MYRIAFACTVIAAMVACKSMGIDTNEALTAQKLEVQLNAAGSATEVEYHIRPNEVPAVVQEAMRKLYPGGRFVGAEKEWNGGKLYYELTSEVGGMEAEAMFYPDGRLFEEEVQVPASKVPAAVKTTATGAMGGMQVRAWEEIRDSNREVFEYHVKGSAGGKNYKLLIGTDGTLMAVFREIPAEIEVQAR